MVNIKDKATNFISQQMKNIADLEMVKVDVEIFDDVRQNKDNEDYKVMFIVENGEEYRVPTSVLEQLKLILESREDLKMFKVVKSGVDLNTKYQVIPLWFGLFFFIYFFLC